MSKWQCNTCGEAVNCDASCVIHTVFGQEPVSCPLSGEVCEWFEIEESKQ